MVERSGGDTLLFVYGTLLRGERNHPYLETSRFLRETATGPGFRLLDFGEYPAMVKAARGTVVGELYRVSPPALARIDRLEDHPDFYWRTRIRLVDRSVAEAYVLPLDRAGEQPEIPSGDWRRRA